MILLKINVFQEMTDTSPHLPGRLPTSSTKIQYFCGSEDLGARQWPSTYIYATHLIMRLAPLVSCCCWPEGPAKAKVPMPALRCVGTE